jgi:hypothetical protein
MALIISSIIFFLLLIASATIGFGWFYFSVAWLFRILFWFFLIGGIVTLIVWLFNRGKPQPGNKV